MKPIIGIVMNFEEEEHRFNLRDYYVSSILDAGGVPVLIPPVKDESLIAQYFALCNGFLLTGGGDIDPSFWSALPHPELGEINPQRDAFEMILARQLLQQSKPVLGICRGCQLLNVAAGGTIIQHINSGMCHDQKAPRYYPFHDIVIEKNTLLAAIIRDDLIRVNSFHHQAVGDIGRELRVCARSADGIIEAIEGTRSGYCLGVQWHPECMQDSYSAQLFQSLIDHSKHL